MAKILDGIRVFDLSIAAAGPWAAKLLGSLGADVIKVEAPEGDIAAFVEPMIKGMGALYICANENKRHVVLDLKQQAHREIAYRLIQRSDVFLQNMRPGVAEKLGFGYQQVATVNPRIVYLSNTAYGRSGPMAMEAGADTTVQAFCGWCSINGKLGSSPEIFRPFAHLDVTTSAIIVQAILQGLIARERFGKGQRIDVDMLHVALAIQATRLAEFFATGVQPRPLGSAAATTVPHQAFLCQDRRYLAIGVVKETQWRAFCRALQFGELASDPRFDSNPKRVEHRTELIPILEQRFKTKPSSWWSLRLCAEKVPNSRFLDAEALRTHIQVLANEYMPEVETPWGVVCTGGLPWKFSRTSEHRIQSARQKGEDTSQVLAEVGMSL